MRKILEKECSPRVVQRVVYRCRVAFPFKYAVDFTDSPGLGFGFEASWREKGEKGQKGFAVERRTKDIAGRAFWHNSSAKLV